MTKPKERVNIYIVHRTWCQEAKYQLIEGNAIETNEMFINIEPMEARNAFGRSRIDKANYMRTAQGAIDYAIRHQNAIILCRQDSLKSAEKDLLRLINLRDIEVGVTI